MLVYQAVPRNLGVHWALTQLTALSHNKTINVWYDFSMTLSLSPFFAEVLCVIG